VLAIAAVGIGTYTMFSTGGTPAHAALPTDTELLFEIPSVHHFADDLSNVRALDASQLVSKQLLSDAAFDLSTTFGVSKTQANALIIAASSLGVGARKLASAPEGGLVLTFSTGTPVNTFLQAKRFSYIGLVSSNGRKYRLTEAPAPPTANADAMSRTLAGLKLDPTQIALVWFETSKVLYVGSPSFALDVARTLSLDAPSLDANAQFQTAKRDFADKSDAILYLDPGHLAALGDARLKAVLGSYLDRPAPISGSFSLLPVGLVAHAVARFSPAPAASAQPPSAVPAPEPLTVAERLPSETFAYAAAVTKTSLSGAELQQLLLEQLGKSDPDTAKEVTAELTQWEQRLQLHLTDLLGSVGDQAAVALLAPKDYSLSLGRPAQMAANFSLVYLQALKDEAPARAQLAQLEQHFGALTDQARIHADEGGFSVVPSDDTWGVSLQAHVVQGYLCLAVGRTLLVERSLHALTAAENTLAADPAYKAARAALPKKAHLISWIDAGRVLNAVAENPLLAPRLHDLGLDRAGLRRVGPERVTAALAVTLEL
ncbi:MAG TPA: hypothetical protein VGL19_06920, partial [Polyangiaceae bacterium]